MTAPTIFVIDDQESVRHAIGEMLSVFGFSVQTFESALHFLDQVEPEQAGCVVADVRMPKMDGIALVTEMARRKFAIPAILISGHADVPMAVAGIKAGAEDFIEKPVDDAMLVAAINRALSRVFTGRETAKTNDDLDTRFTKTHAATSGDFRPCGRRLHQPGDRRKADLSTRTVESYRAQVMEKMQAESVAVLVRQAVRLKRIEP